MAQSSPLIEYTVNLTSPQTQSFEVSMRIRNVTENYVTVALPVWRAGRYSILNPAGTLSQLSAVNGSGGSLRASKIDKTTWQIETAGNSEIQVRYNIYANSLGDRTRHVDQTHAFLSGATVFLFVPERRSEAVSVHIEAPNNWKLSCGLDGLESDPFTLLSPSYDVLIDSPIEIGLHDTLHFEVEGIPHEIILWNAPPFDREKLTREFAAIVKQHFDLFGGLPYRRYIFMIHVSPGIGGGTEHLNSTIIQVPTKTFEEPAKYRRLLGTAAHEMFHVWNVKRLRPAALAAASLSAETYTDLLWFCEGTTSYYEELMLVRAGLISPDEYLLELSEWIHKCRVRPGSKVQSVAESSFDAWIKFNQPTPNDMNTTVSFYESGAVVSFLLDLELRTRSGNRVSMDTLMVEMVRRFPATGAGFTTADLIAVADVLTGTSFEKFFASYIQSTEPYPFEDRVGVVGLRLALDADGVLPYSGIVTQMQNGKNIVRYVLSDGPAYPTGVLPGDEITNEPPATPGTLVNIDLIRRGSPISIEFTMGSIPKGRWRLSRIENPMPDQRSAYSNWLRQLWGQTGSDPTIMGTVPSFPKGNVG